MTDMSVAAEVELLEGHNRNSGFVRNAAAVAISGAISGVLGLGYWLVAGRLFPAESVGTAAAILSTATMVATLSSASIGAIYERFLPVAHSLARRMVVLGQLATIGFALLAAVIIGFVGPVSHYLHGIASVILFAVLQVTLSIFALQDHLATALGVARWTAYKNVAHATIKLALLAVLSTVGTTLSIIASWWAPALIAGAAVALATRVRLRNSSTSTHTPDLPPASEMASFFLGSAGILIAGTLVPLVMPILVLARFGASQSAYFAVSWSLISAAVVVMYMMIGPFVSAVVEAPQSAARGIIVRFGIIIATVAITAGICLGLIGPLLLKAVGSEYYENGKALMYYSAGIVPLSALFILYQAVSRVRRRLRYALVLQVVSAALILTGVLMTPVDDGIASIGMWYLAAESAVAVLCVIPLIRGLALIAKS